MQPWHVIERAVAPDSTELTLARRGDEWVVRVASHVLMSSRMHGSEESLASLALEQVKRPSDVLVGGLGLGFTVRAALDRLPPGARVVVSELVPDIVQWNRGHVAHLAGRPLEDGRVSVRLGDVRKHLAEARGAYDALLLDVDNGPSPVAHRDNAALYGEAGVRACFGALRPGGVLAVWSAGPDARYLVRLERAGFIAEAREVSARERRGVRHVIFLGRKIPRKMSPA